jgi:elongation factor Ts
MLKQLRTETGAGLLACKKALETSGGDLEKAKEILSKQGLLTAQTKQDRETNEGIIVSYIHPNLKLGSFLEIRCETDFVAKNEIFTHLANQIAIHISATDPENVGELLVEPYIKNEEITIGEMIQQAVVKLGENIVVTQFSRFKI